jgi:DNA polymerase-4
MCVIALCNRVEAGAGNLGRRGRRTVLGRTARLHVERRPIIRRMFGHNRGLPFDWRSPEKVGERGRRLALSAARRLRRTNKSASKITVSMRGRAYNGLRSYRDKTLRWGCQLNFVAAPSDHAILAALSLALTRSNREVTFSPRAVSVVVHGLLNETEIQCDLFTGSVGSLSADAQSERAEKRELLSDTIDPLRAVHGPAAISYDLRSNCRATISEQKLHSAEYRICRI